MYRRLLTAAAVAAICCVLSHLDAAQAEHSREHLTLEWVRTSDGWEPASTLHLLPSRSNPPALHPLLVAGFQLGASIFALIAFPRVEKLSRAENPALR